MNKYRSQGGPFHQEYLSMGEDDERRHKSRCVHYYNKGKCRYLCGNCIGSSCCDYYKEKSMSKDYTDNQTTELINDDKIGKCGFENELKKDNITNDSNKKSSINSLEIMRDIWRTIGR